MRTQILISLVTLSAIHFSVFADDTPAAAGVPSDFGGQPKAVLPTNNKATTAPMPTTTQTAVPESKDEKAYQEKLMQISDAIAKKISEVQAKQKELDEEIYPASKPEIQAGLDDLNKQLEVLKMQREQLSAEKTANDIAKKMQNHQQ